MLGAVELLRRLYALDTGQAQSQLPLGVLVQLRRLGVTFGVLRERGVGSLNLLSDQPRVAFVLLFIRELSLGLHRLPHLLLLILGSVGDEPALRGLVHLADALSPEVLDELRQRGPPRGVHVDVRLVRDVLVVHDVGAHPAVPVRRGHHVEEGPLELLAVVADELPLVHAEDLHLAEVGLAGAVALEAVRVPALLLADLAVELELLQALRLRPVGDILRGSRFGLLPHGAGVGSSRGGAGESPGFLGGAPTKSSSGFHFIPMLIF